MKLLVHTGSKGETNRPLLSMVDFYGPSFNAHTAERVSVDLKSLHNPLSSDTQVRSGYEEVFKKAFLELGLRVDYEPFSLNVGKFAGRAITFTPDFVTEVRIGKRQVIVEPHGMHNHKHEDLEAEMIKLKMFRSVYKDMFYLVVASDLSHQALRLRTELTLGKTIDEYWETPMDRSLTKTTVTERLHDLLRRSKMSTK